MGRAIARHPSTFLMDEPLSNLDAKLRNHLRAEISKLTRDLGATTVYVTHDQAEAMSLGDRVAVMRGGVLQQLGTPRTVYGLPANVFVAAFIGTPRINLLRGLVRAPLDGAMTISLGKQYLRLPEPLCLDHQLLRVQQGREVIVGLRSEAIRLARASDARPGEVAITGLVEHVEFQGHEVLVHFNTGSRPAFVPDLESPRPSRPTRRRRRDAGTVLDRLRGAPERCGPDRSSSSTTPRTTRPITQRRHRPRGGCPAISSSAPRPTSNSATACRSRSSWTSPTCSSSTGAANGSARHRSGFPTWRSDSPGCAGCAGRGLRAGPVIRRAAGHPGAAKLSSLV